jgi:protein N-terminal glutamine amidohydrolase
MLFGYRLVTQDYHVFVLNQYTSEVFDLDSTLSFPCEFNVFCKETLQPQIELPKEFSRYFRIIPAPLFLKHFCSDRSHMVSSGKPMPVLPCIGQGMNLYEYIDMSPKDSIYGTVVDETEFLRMKQL